MDDNHFYAFFLDNEKRPGWMRCDIFCSEAEEEYFLAEEIFLGESGLYPGQTMVYLFDLGVLSYNSSGLFPWEITWH